MGAWSQTLLGLTIALTASACGARGASSEGLYFPQFQAQPSQPIALLEGVIRRDGRCLLLDSAGRENLAIWSSDFRAVDSEEGITITDGGGRALAREGAPAVFGGGEYKAEHLDFVEGLVGAIPADCQRSHYYLVASIPSDG